MDALLDTLRDLASQVGVAVADAFGRSSVREVSEADVVAVMDAAGSLLRGAEALLVEAAGEVERRSDSPTRGERMTTRFGCRNAAELVQRVTRVSGRSAADIVRAGRAVSMPVALVTGESLPARFPATRAALADGVVGVDAVVAITATVDAAAGSPELRAAVDAELAASARGEGVDAGPAATADDLRLQAQVWAAYLDPDGAEPRDEAAQRQRGVTLGRVRDGLATFGGRLTADVAAQLQREFDAILNPRTGGPEFVDTLDPDSGEAHDPRTAAQKRHDAFATILTVAAASGALPTLGGAAPTLIVSTREEDLISGTGVGHIDGVDEPVPLTIVRHVGCLGGVYKVTLQQNGRVKDLKVIDRSFTAHQRKVITLRDGECVIPGCHVPAAWCEIHHVTEWARGGATATDNGVMLCWHHHRTLDTSGWRIRMRSGVPEVQGPDWWDPHQTWRPVTKSPTRIREHLTTRIRQ